MGRPQATENGIIDALFGIAHVLAVYYAIMYVTFFFELSGSLSVVLSMPHGAAGMVCRYMDA